MPFYLSTGVYPQTIDLSAGVQAVATSIGAVVQGSKQGPLGPKLLTGGYTQYQQLYGAGDNTWTKAHHCVRAFLRRAQWLYVNRVNNNATYAGTMYYNDSTTRTINQKFTSGTTTDYSGQSHEVTLLSISDALITSNQISVTVTDGTASPTEVSTVFATDSNTTLATFASGLQSQINSYGSGGSVSVYDEWTGPNVKQQLTLTFSAPFTTGMTWGATVTVDGTATVVSPVAYSTSGDNTMSLIAAALGGVTGVTATIVPAAAGSVRQILVLSDNAGPSRISIGTFTGAATPPTATVEETQTGHGVKDDRIVRVISPPGVSLTFSAFAVTLGSSQASATLQSNKLLFDVFAQNPGAWANSVGIKTQSLSVGVQQKTALTFAGPLIAANEFTCSLTDVTSGTVYNVGPVTFATDSDTTLAAIATAIKTKLDVIDPVGRGSAVVTAVAGGTSNDVEIIVTSPIAGSSLTFANLNITGGASQTSVTALETLTGYSSDNTFMLLVYTRDNISAPVEQFRVSLQDLVDESGNSTYIENVINDGPLKSSYIRINLNEANEDLTMYNVDSGIRWLQGGADGAVPTNAQIMNGWDQFADPDKYTIRILINAGYTDPSVQQKMNAIATARRDCFAVLDMPSNVQDTEDALNYRKFTLNISSSYAAIYTPDLQILDPNSNKKIYIPPSGHVAGQFAFTDQQYAVWYAPSGLDRGIIEDVIGVRVVYNNEDRNILEPAGVNSLRQFPSVGIAIWGAETLQATRSDLSNINVRRLLILLEVSIVDSLFRFNWAPGNRQTQFNIFGLINNFLKQIVNGEGLVSYYIDIQATPELMQAQTLIVNVYIKPTLPIKFILLNTIITPQNVQFSELIAQRTASQAAA